MDGSPRREYEGSALDEADLAADPFEQFGRWMADAAAAGVYEPNAMILSTSGPEGRPSARAVLLKGYGPEGFTFFTNRRSRKGRELAANPQAALTFLWDFMHRQVRIEGPVVDVPDDEADAYFAGRPPGARIGAAASPQSDVIPDRAWLERRVAELWARYPDGDVPRPPHWGGYRVVAEVFEFWQGRENRLHDRFRYRRVAGRWNVDRLAP